MRRIWRGCCDFATCYPSRMRKPDSIGRTMRVAHQLKAEGAGEVAVAHELIEIRVARGDADLSLVARRALLLMLEAAAGDAWRYQFHRIAKAELRGSHRSLEHVRPALDELTSIVFTMPDTLEGKPATRRFPLLDEIADHNDNVASALIEFRFSRRACDILRQSDVYARLSREAIVRFQSRYSLRCYEVGSVLYNRRNPTWRGDVEALRALLHVPAGTYPNFADFRRRVLEIARDELHQLAEFDMSWTEQRRGRQIIGIELRFTGKPGRKALAAAEERARHSAGRRVRRDATAETLVAPGDVAALVGRTAASLSALPPLQWPADDSVSEFDKDAELYRIGVAHGGGHAVDRLARAYAEFMGDTRLALTGERLRSSWRGFCDAKAAQWREV